MSTPVKISYAEKLTELRENLKQMLPQNIVEIFDADATAQQNKHHTILKLNKGDKAPNFSLVNHLGNPITLFNLLQKNKVVLVFYRGTWCPYCNLQLAHYQADLKKIKALGAELIAISPQTPDESLSIKEKNELQFDVLSDNGNNVAKHYTTIFKNDPALLAAMAELGYDFDSYYADNSREIPVPAVFIIDQNGTISFAETTGGDYRKRVDSTHIINHLKNN